MNGHTRGCIAGDIDPECECEIQFQRLRIELDAAKGVGASDHEALRLASETIIALKLLVKLYREYGSPDLTALVESEAKRLRSGR